MLCGLWAVTGIALAMLWGCLIRVGQPAELNQWKRYRGVMNLRADHWRTLDLRGLK